VDEQPGLVVASTRVALLRPPPGGGATLHATGPDLQAEEVRPIDDSAKLAAAADEQHEHPPHRRHIPDHRPVRLPALWIAAIMAQEPTLHRDAHPTTPPTPHGTVRTTKSTFRDDNGERRFMRGVLRLGTADAPQCGQRISPGPSPVRLARVLAM
jgi:hypothetical protein